MFKLYEFRVIFNDREMLVVGRDREEAQDRAICELEDAGEVVGTIEAIRRVQQV